MIAEARYKMALQMKKPAHKTIRRGDCDFSLQIHTSDEEYIRRHSTLRLFV